MASNTKGHEMTNIRNTSHNIEDTDETLVYEWVKTGVWNKSMFLKWLSAVIDAGHLTQSALYVPEEN